MRTCKKPFRQMLDLLREDLKTVREKDPAARSNREVLLYPHIHALWTYRVAHWLWRRGHRTTARALSLLARSGGVKDEFTFTGGVANNPAAVLALRALVEENYGPRTLNISPGSIYTGALGAALFSLRAAEEGRPAA